jgi:hypothetical protein
MNQQNWTSEAESVRDQAGQKRDNGRKHKWWRSEYQAIRRGETHPFSQDQGRVEVVGEAWNHGREDKKGPAIELPVLQMLQDLADGNWVLLCITPVDIDALHDESLLVRLQESIGLVREVDEEEEPCDADSTGDAAFNDHDPFTPHRQYIPTNVVSG